MKTLLLLAALSLAAAAAAQTPLDRFRADILQPRHLPLPEIHATWPMAPETQRDLRDRDWSRWYAERARHAPQHERYLRHLAREPRILVDAAGHRADTLPIHSIPLSPRDWLAIVLSDTHPDTALHLRWSRRQPHAAARSAQAALDQLAAAAAARAAETPQLAAFARQSAEAAQALRDHLSARATHAQLRALRAYLSQYAPT